MTDKEKAEEWVKSNSDESVYSFQGEQLQNAFLAGLKAGRPQWHKPSEKLPEECSLVLAYLFEETEPTICEYVVSNQWECLPKRIMFCSNDQVRLWKEIVPPEEIE